VPVAAVVSDQRMVTQRGQVMAQQAEADKQSYRIIPHYENLRTIITTGDER
jgi:hypothetical protein